MREKRPRDVQDRIQAGNGPCREFLPSSGFSRDGDRFVYAADDVGPDPVWLTVQRVAGGAR